jgi:hypothetical protein
MGDRLVIVCDRFNIGFTMVYHINALGNLAKGC